MDINGSALQAIRERSGLTQSDLARETERIGPRVSQGRISELESGDPAKSAVRPATAKVLADALSVPLVALLRSAEQVAS